MKKRALFVVAFLTVFLCACSRSEQPADTQPQEDERTQVQTQVQVRDDSENWVAHKTVLPGKDEYDESLVPDDDWATEFLCAWSGESIYRFMVICTGIRGVDFDYTGCYIQKLEPPYEQWITVDSIGLDEFAEGDLCRPWSYFWTNVMNAQGQITTFLQGEETVYLCQWTESTGYTVKRMDEGFLQQGGDDANDIQFMYVDADQNIYLADSRGILHGRTDQGLQRISTGKGTALYIGENVFQGKLYHSGYTAEAGFYVQSLESERPEFSTNAVDMQSGDKVIWCSETEGYLCSKDAVWKFSLDTQEISMIIQLWSQGIHLDKLLDAKTNEDGTVCLLAEIEGEYALLDISPDTGKEEKITLELVTFYASDCLKQAVFRFNKSNSEYHVEIKEAEEDTMLADFRTRILAELSAGNGPDLLTDYIFANNRVDQMADKKMLLELTEFFREEEEDILPNVWSSGKVGEDVYAIPYDCMIETLATSKNLVGDRTGWTSEELVQCTQKSGVKQFCPNMNGVELFWYLCGGIGFDSDIIDWENRTCHFDNEKVEELLKFTKEYSGEHDYLMSTAKVLEGEALVERTFIYSPSSANGDVSVYQNGQVYIGFPTVNGESGHILDASMIGINSNTDHVEGAVAFLKYIISEDMQEYMAESACKSNMPTTSLPVNKEALEHLYGYLLNEPTGEDEDKDKIFFEYPPEYWEGDGKYVFPSLPFTEDSVQQLRNVIETAIPWRSGTSEIFDIMAEEAEAYLSGDREAKDVLAVIQNRVQLYLDEMN